MGALKGQKKGWGSLTKVGNFDLLYFDIMFEWSPEFFLNDRKGVPEKHKCYQLGSGHFFCIENIFSSIPQIPLPLSLLRPK